MVHSKVVVIDHRWSDVGSANFTSLSHGVYDEINLYADCEPFARALEAEIDAHCDDGRVADSAPDVSQDVLGPRARDHRVPVAAGRLTWRSHASIRATARSRSAAARS